MLAIQQLRGENIESILPEETNDREKDLFELPEDHLRSQLADNENNEDDNEDVVENLEFEPVAKIQGQRTTWSRKRTDDNIHGQYDLPKFNEMDEDALGNLPTEMQHEILTNMKESLKRGHTQIEDMPQKSDDFSDYQVQKLLKQNQVSQKIAALNKTLKRQRFDIALDSDAQIYAGKLASDANTQYILIKSGETPKNPSITNLSGASSSSTPSPSFSRQSTSDFCVNNLMNRDPVTGRTQRRSIPNDIDFTINTSDSEPSPPIQDKEPTKTTDDELVKEKPLSVIDVIDKVTTTTQGADEENIALEIAIQRSLEDQQISTLDKSNTASNTVESSSESDDSDFIDVPTIPKSTEPIVFPRFIDDDDNDLNKTTSSNNNKQDNNTSSDLIELENDNNDDNDSSHNSTAIEDIKMFIKNDLDQSTMTHNEIKESISSELECFSQEKLERIEAELINDTASQLTTARGHERLATTLTDTMHEDAQYLLRLFGIPFLISPTEAEAQCAYLDLSNQCDGVITDDSDVWLFGASHVYRNFFRQEQLVEYYDATVIANQLGLDRESMIAIGMIVGSDYTKGIANAGIMTALEILQEFHGTCMERLEKFRRWWKKAQKTNFKTQSKSLKHLKNLELFEGFPHRAVYDAYKNPKVDCDQTKFSWAMPQLELIREFIGGKLKWDRRKIDDMILPVIKRINTKEIQSRIDSFFVPVLFEATSSQSKRNTRLRTALDLLKQKTQAASDEGNNESSSSADDDTSVPVKPKLKPKRQTKTTKLMSSVLSSVDETKRRALKRTTIDGPVLSDDDTV